VTHRNEIKEAAETIACTCWGRGGSLDQIQLEIQKAFESDGPAELRVALDYAEEWVACMDVRGDIGAANKTSFTPEEAEIIINNATMSDRHKARLLGQCRRGEYGTTLVLMGLVRNQRKA